MKKHTFKLFKNSISPAMIITEPFIEMLGNKEFVFTGKTEVTEVGETVLKIKSNEHRIFIFGKDFEVNYYTFEGIKISGMIERIEFEKGE